MTAFLGCPRCRRTALESVEKMDVHFVVTVTRQGHTEINVEYDESEPSRDFPDTAEATGAYWCTYCDMELDEDELVPVSEDV